jgi:hypothetical protein
LSFSQHFFTANAFDNDKGFFRLHQQDGCSIKRAGIPLWKDAFSDRYLNACLLG